MRWRLIFLCFFMSLFGMAAAAESEEDKKEEDTFRYRFRDLGKQKETKGAKPRVDEHATSHGLSKEEMVAKQKEVTEIWQKRKGGEITKQDVVKLYSTAKDFSVVHSLLGGVISADDSRAIGRLRAEIHEEVLQSLAKSKRFGSQMGVNDFGSGADLSTVDAKTDIDFTLYNKMGAAGAAMVEAYKQEFKRITGQYGAGIDPGQCDIVAHRYEATIPDWRQGADLAMFETKLRTGLDLLRKNPEAYFLEGAYMQQVMKRSVDPNGKTFAWYSVDEGGTISKEMHNAALQKEYFYHPEFRDRYAFGGAVGNWHFFHAHGGDQVARAKYILRSIDDGIGMLHPEMKKGDFEKMSRADQAAFINQVYGGKFSPEIVAGITATLENSIRMRELKKNKTLDLASVQGQIEAYRPIVEYIMKQNPGVVYTEADIVKQAEAHFNKIGNAILIENNIQSSTGRLNDWLKPPLKPGEKMNAVDENGNPKQYIADGEMINRLQYAAFFELHSALSLMDAGLIQRIKGAHPKFARDIEILEGIIKKKKEMLSAPDDLEGQKALDWKKARAAEVQAEITRLRGVLETKGYSAALFEGTKSAWDAGQRFEGWMQNAMIDTLVARTGGKRYIPLLNKLREEVQRKNEEGLGGKWMARLDKANSLIEVLKVYAREGEINANVLKVAAYEALSFVPGMGILYSIQGGVQGVSTLVFANLIPGYGQILLVMNVTRGSVELAGLMVFEPLKKDKILLAYQGYLPPEKGGWFSSGQKERVDAPGPALLYPVDPSGTLPLDERREKMYQYLHKVVIDKMKSNPAIGFTEEENPKEWQNEEFNTLRGTVTNYVNDWWEGKGLFQEFDVLTVHRGPDVRQDLESLLIQDYIRGKNIALQKMVLERQKQQEALVGQYMDIASGEYALENGGESFKNDYNQFGEHVNAFILDDMPAIEPSLEIVAAQNYEEIETDPEKKAKEILSENINFRAIINASFKDYPGPWKIDWTIDNSQTGNVVFEWGKREELEAKSGSVTVTAVAKDSTGKEIARASIPCSVEKVKIEEAKKKEEKEDAPPDISDLLEKLKAAAAQAQNLSEDAQKNCDSSKEKAKEAVTNIEKAEGKIKEVETKITELQTEMTALFEEITNTVDEAKELDEIGKKIAVLRDTIEQKALESCQETQKILGASTKQEQQERLDAIEKLRIEIMELEEQAKELSEKAKEIGEKLKKLDEKVKKFGEKLDQTQTDLESKAPETVDTHGEVIESQNDSDTAKNKTKELGGVHTQAGGLLKEGEDIIKPVEDKFKDLKSALEEMKQLFGTIQKLKESVETCPEEISSFVDDAANRQTKLEETLKNAQTGLKDLQDKWGSNQAKELLQKAVDDAEAAKFLIDVYIETIGDRLKDRETCEKLAKEAASKPPKFIIPDVVGKSVEEAITILEKLDLVISASGTDPAPTPEKALTVRGQTPKANSRGKAGDNIIIEIYGEFTEKATVPNVVGLHWEVASEKLKKAGFSPTPVGGDPAPEEKLSFTIAGQEPAGDTEAQKGKEVIIVTYGEYVKKPVFTVPDVVGMDHILAETKLSESGFTPGGKEEDAATKKEEEGQVYSQSIPAGKEYEKEGESVSFSYYGKMKEEKPLEPTEQPIVEYFVAVRSYWPQPIAKPPKDPKLVQGWYARLTLRDVRFELNKELFFLKIAAPATDLYPADMFAQGKKLSLPLHIMANVPEGGKINLDGAILLEVVNFYTDKAKFVAENPAAADPKKMMIFNNAEGTFSMVMAEKGTTSTLSGGPLVKGWPENMRQKALDLFKNLVLLIKCYIATTVYETPTAPEIHVLRDFRDNVMLQSDAGRSLVAKYYTYGPMWAFSIDHDSLLKHTIKIALDLTAKVISTIDWTTPAAKHTIEMAMSAADTVWSWFINEDLTQEVNNEKNYPSRNNVPSPLPAY